MENNTSTLIVGLVAALMIAAVVPAVIIANEDNDAGYVEITVWGNSQGFGFYFESTMNALKENGGKNFVDVSIKFPGSAAFKCKVPSDWSFKHLDDIMYPAAGNQYYPVFDGPGGGGLFETDGNVYNGLVCYMHNGN